MINLQSVSPKLQEEFLYKLFVKLLIELDFAFFAKDNITLLAGFYHDKTMLK
jgi:hypothetical protein